MTCTGHKIIPGLSYEKCSVCGYIATPHTLERINRDIRKTEELLVKASKAERKKELSQRLAAERLERSKAESGIKKHPHFQ